jgi:hypothetical protein
MLFGRIRSIRIETPSPPIQRDVKLIHYSEQIGSFIVGK